MSVWAGRVYGLTMVGLGIALLLGATFGETASSTSIGVVLAMVPWIGVGAFIVATRPRNPVGWLFSAVGLLWLSGEVVYDWALGFADSSDSFLPYASLYAASYWIPGLGLLVVAVMLFPSGRLPSPGWRPAFALVVTGLTLAFARAALAMEVRAGDDGLVVDNPIGLGFLGLVTFRDEELMLIVLLTSAVTAVICFVARFRRSRGVERQQLKWMALAVPAFVASWILAALAEPWPLLANALRSVSLVLIPLAAGLAITRFRLYDVDRVISRTTSYALVTGVLLGVYGVVVTSVTRVVPSSSQWAVAVATLAAAALFRPALQWSRRVVDRRFNREQYDAQLAVESFADQLRDEVDPRLVLAGLLSVVDRTVAPAEVGLWVRDGER